MKKIMILAVLVTVVACSGCGGVGPTSLGLALIDAKRKSNNAMENSKGADISWMDDTSKVAIDPVKPEDYEPVKTANPTPEQMERFQKEYKKFMDARYK